ncbi:MAG: ribosomal protein L11 methyltransferase [Planctomycetota bacterium]|jgi:ribosomal protein L11 methyltransferase
MSPNPTPPSPAPKGTSGREGWLELRVDVPHGFEELVAEALRQDESATVLTEGPAEPPAAPGCSAVRTFLSPREDHDAAQAKVEDQIGKLAQASGLEELEGLLLVTREIPASDWANAWRDTWRPFRVGHICVVPSWRTKPLRDDDIALQLEPGGVFGTGRHPTTRTCLRELQQLPTAGKRLVDVGTGTGILAVAAALLGAAEVFGFDIDADSEGYAGELARDNGIGDEQLRFATGGFELLGSLEGPVDGIMANIYHDILQDHGQQLGECLRPGGWFLFSGIHRRHRAATRAAVEAGGLRVNRDLRAGNWCSLVGVRT